MPRKGLWKSFNFESKYHKNQKSLKDNYNSFLVIRQEKIHNQLVFNYESKACLEK